MKKLSQQNSRLDGLLVKSLRVEELKSNDNEQSSIINSSPLHHFISSTKAFGFTMAEILLSLTIIGVVAAITLPSLTGNINERTWNTQRKALFARMSQAIALMPSINSYGVGANDTATINNAAETFITNGLSKVLKINNICGTGDDRFKCGLSSQIVTLNGTKINLPAEIRSLNTDIITNASPVSLLSTKAAAFETANGESILVFYNPKCTAENVLVAGSGGAGTLHGSYVKQHVCANFIFDLNGKKGPNTVGKDIGLMSVIYSSDSKVVMPLYPKAVSGTKRQALAAEECQKLDEGQYRLPNIEELLSIYYNRTIFGSSFWNDSTFAWSGTSKNATQAYGIGNRFGIKYTLEKNNDYAIVCVQR